MLCAGGLSLALMEVHAQSAALRHSAAGGNYQILIKAPPPTQHSFVEEIAPICAEGFNKAFQKCTLGGPDDKSNMHIYTAAGKAYCGYVGGWAIPDYYKDHTACFVSPGQSEALFYDQNRHVLTTWEGQIAVSGVSEYSGNALSCQGSDLNSPCSTYVRPLYRRVITNHQKPEEMIPGQDRLLNWHQSVGYVGITTIWPGEKLPKQMAVYIKNLVHGDALSTNVPCGQSGSVTDMVGNFPIKGMASGCGNENGDYYMLLGRQVTVCFPGASC